MVHGLAALRGWRPRSLHLRAVRPLAKRARSLAALGLAALLPALMAQPAAAQIGSDRYASFVMDGRSGNPLGGANADEPRYPASLTKMMTLYMLFDAMREGRLTMNSRIYISEEANSRMPSKLGVPPGMTIPVEVAIYALTMKSANDVATAVGEALGGTEERFAQMMTQRARQLGMTSTTFRNASGLPDYNQTTTARDMAILGRRLFLDFPERWHFFGNSTIRTGNYAFRSHNRMIGEYEGVDGVKTGYINASGFNNVVSAQRGGQRVFVSVFGGSSWVERDRHAAMLLDDGFARLGVGPSRAPEAAMVMARVPSFAGRARAATAEAATPRSNIRQVTLRTVRPAPRQTAQARGRRAVAAVRPAAASEARAARQAAKPGVRAGTRSSARAARTRQVMEQGDGGRLVRVSTPPRRPAARAKPARSASRR
jgi:D-alanyl-D-alanine carboxypeptidase